MSRRRRARRALALVPARAPQPVALAGVFFDDADHHIPPDWAAEGQASAPSSGATRRSVLAWADTAPSYRGVWGRVDPMKTGAKRRAVDLGMSSRVRVGWPARSTKPTTIRPEDALDFAFRRADRLELSRLRLGGPHHVCVGRVVRRRVLFASGAGGLRGRPSPRRGRRRRSVDSSFSCPRR